MKRFLILTSALALIVGTIASTSCTKPKEEATAVKVEVTDITATTATVNISVSGKAAQMVRAIKPVSVDAIGINVEDLAAVSSYVGSNGTAVGIPYSSVETGLEAASDYVVAAVAFDENFQVVSTAVQVFSTQLPDNAAGDVAGAGEITNKKW